MSRVVHQVASPLDSAREPSHIVVEIPGSNDFAVVEYSTQSAAGEFDELATAILCADGLSFLKQLHHLQEFLDEEDSVIAITKSLIIDTDEPSILHESQISNSSKIDIENYLNAPGLSIVTSALVDGLRSIQYSPFIKDRPESIFVQGIVPSLSLDKGHENSMRFLQIEFAYDRLGYISALEIKVLKNDYEFSNEKFSMSQLMLNVLNSPTHSAYIESADDRVDWMPVIEEMPLYSKNKKEAERIYVFEGGPVLESLADKQPWMVEKGSNGLPVPLRIVEVSEGECFGEHGMKLEAARQAGQYVVDVLSTDALCVRQNSLQQAFREVAGTTLASWGLRPPAGQELDMPTPGG